MACMDGGSPAVGARWLHAGRGAILALTLVLAWSGSWLGCSLAWGNSNRHGSSPLVPGSLPCTAFVGGEGRYHPIVREHEGKEREREPRTRALPGTRPPCKRTRAKNLYFSSERCHLETTACEISGQSRQCTDVAAGPVVNAVNCRQVRHCQTLVQPSDASNSQPPPPSNPRAACHFTLPISHPRPSAPLPPMLPAWHVRPLLTLSACVPDMQTSLPSPVSGLQEEK